MTVRIAALSIYPVKSGRALTLSTATLGLRGFDGDRAWMLVRPDGRFMSQRTHPALACLDAQPTPGGLKLRFRQMAPLLVEDAAGGTRREVTVWEDRMWAADAGEAAAHWLSEALGEAVRLVRLAAETRRLADPHYAGALDAPVSFSDGFPILVCTVASLDALNARLEAPVPMERFRPNIVLDGLDPFAEDGIRALRIRGTVLHLVKPCTRCSIPSIDQMSGASGINPLAVLKEFRYDAALKGATFGVNAIAEGGVGTTLADGDLVEVIA